MNFATFDEFMSLDACTLAELPSLNLSAKRILNTSEFWSQLGLCRNLTSLSLSFNNLGVIPAEAFNKLFLLEYLYLADNDLVALPDSLWRLTSLRRLDVSHNQLDSVSYSIEQLVCLRELALDHNKLTTLPGSLWQLPLKILFLEYNRLTALPENASQSVALEELTLHNNHLITIPDPIKQLPQLGRLTYGVVRPKPMLPYMSLHGEETTEEYTTYGTIRMFRHEGRRIRTTSDHACNCRLS